MERLGYTRYVAQGGDWGAFVVDQMGLQALRDCSASTPTCLPPFQPTFKRRSIPAARRHPVSPPEEKRAFDQLELTFKQVDYARMMGTRPQTLYGIADSPVGLAAWLLDHMMLTASLRPRSIARVFDGRAPQAN